MPFFLPVKTCAPAPPAPPTRAPIAAPLPPPSNAPRTAPTAAPPPTYFAVRVLAPSPELHVLLPPPAAVRSYRRPLTVTDRRSRIVSFPSLVGAATSRAWLPRGTAIAPEVSGISSLTVAV